MAVQQFAVLSLLSSVDGNQSSVGSFQLAVSSTQSSVDNWNADIGNEKYFRSKLSDADSENSETQLWLDFAFACEYITETEKNELQTQSNEVGKLINYMMNNPSTFGI